ncbi:hypothetical protein ABT119_06035 [Streptomyces sp. NPDC001910]|uniref:hypothetical protein n=1 Tax=Streptomyces sp. NPDC001910 TaxID=3154403 RepID=UPI00332DF55A
MTGHDARRKLIDALNEEHNPSYWGGEPRDAERLVNDFAHSLAEKIRNASEAPQAWDDDYYRGEAAAADLIDPEMRP